MRKFFIVLIVFTLMMKEGQFENQLQSFKSNRTQNDLLRALKKTDTIRTSRTQNYILGEALVCYTDIEANSYKFCDEFDGYQSCYATYDKGNNSFTSYFR